MNLLVTCMAYVLTLSGMIIIKKIKIFDKEFFRFCIVGVCNTLNYFVIFTSLHLGVEYVIAHVLAFVVSGLISYVLTTMYTFNEQCVWETFIRFPLTFLPNLIMSTIGTVILVQFKIINEDFASLVMMFAAIPITFLVSKVLYTKGRCNGKN